MPYIDIINNHLWASDDWFLNYIHDKNTYDSQKFNDLLNYVKLLKESWDVMKFIDIKHDDCYWWSFISNIIHWLLHLNWIAKDNQKYKYIKNISSEDFYDNILLLSSECEALFFLQI
jgi:hypothetical protein